MVVIAGLLGVLVKQLIARNSAPIDILYCSNLNASDSFNFPDFVTKDSTTLPKTGANSVVGQTESSVTHVNFLQLTTPISNTQNGPPGASSGLLKKPCVFKFNSLYSDDDPTYLSDESAFRRDTTYWPTPRGGFLNTTLDATIASYLSQYQTLPWYVYASDPSVPSLGTRPRLPFSTLADVLLSPPFTPANASSGLLGTIESRFYSFALPNGAQTLQSVPWYNVTSGTTSESLDAVIGRQLSNLISQLARVNNSVLSRANPSREALNAYYTQIQVLILQMPHGGVFFKTVDHAAKNYEVTFSTGGDSRLDRAAGFPQQGFRQAIQLTQLSNAILRSGNSTLGDASISQSIRSMPKLQNTGIQFPIASFIGRILYPFGVSFLLPIFAIILVKEKEDRILIMMQMNGLKTWAYYLSHYLHFYTMHVASSAMFLIAGALLKLEMFSRTDGGVLILMFFFWGHVQIALAFLFSTLFTKSRTALVAVFLIVLLGVVVSIATEQLFTGDAPAIYFIWPPFAFYRILSKLNMFAYTITEKPYTMSKLVPGDEVFTAFIFIIVEIFVIFAISAYLQSVIPSEYGVTKKWHWPISQFLEARQKNVALTKVVSPGSTSQLNLEDDDVKAERLRIESHNYDPASPLIVQNMRKEYAGRGGSGPTLAVKNITLAIEKGITFGLLGPNGAGKTTLISILTGLYNASAGEASIAGYNIVKEREQVYRVLGVCPQHDILWDDLTCQEHLLFYARLKGVDSKHEIAEVTKSLNTVSLGPFKDRLSKGLSGGEKRRLSIAIALVGDPKVVFLDEPTTGLDPEVRRLIWNIINEARAGKTIVLTTHSMEEAEVLCQRIGIMAKGILRCIGPQLRLKQLYGTGFRIQFICNSPEDTAKACAYIEGLLPPGYKKLDSFATNVNYEFLPFPGLISDLFERIEKEKKHYGIVDWGLSQTTLEEVFVRLISEADAQAD